mgnify:CR=1 FL=1
MKLDIFNKLANDAKENNLLENFIKELTKSIEKTKEQAINTNEIINNNNELKTENTLEQEEISDKEILEQQELEQNREENCLYQVVDFSAKGVYLLNKNTNKIFEETEISQELKNQIQNDSILRYKNGEYVYEEELTEEFFNNLENIDQ